MPDARKLNPEQLQAVTHGDGPLLIIAGAGTGKTTVITKRIQHLILDKKVNPSNILALTFTEKAAQEMQARTDEILPYGYSQMWIETFHAFCDRILRQEAIHIGLTPSFQLMTEAETMLFLRKHLFEFELDYFRPMGNPMKFLQGMLTHFSRLRDDDITPEQYMTFAKEFENRNHTEQADILEAKKTMELAKSYLLYESLKAKEGMMDFSNLITNTLRLFRERPNILRKYQEQFQYILVDEFQDTNFAQNELAILLAGEKKNITVVGDDDQCLPANTLVTTIDGKKPIKDIKTGEQVITAVGKGSLGIATVTNVFKNKKTTRFITVTTKSGMTVTTTDNHKMFCYVPKYATHKKFFYVYLIHRKSLGWRLGVTNNLAVRLKLERSADAIIGLRAFLSAEEARYHELLWSLTYQLPTCIFKEHDGVMLQGALIEKLYKQFDSEANAKRLAADLGINLMNYHYVLDAVTRGNSKRIKIHFYQCYRNYAQKRTPEKSIMHKPQIGHLVQMETSNEEIITKIKESALPYTKAKKGIRIRHLFGDIIKAQAFANRLVNLTDGFIEMKSIIGTLTQVNMPALIMPAGNLLEGLFLPIVKNNKVFYDEIVSLEREQREELVYDLEVDKTHNFIANDIVVHNSIYRWRGAAIANMMQFRSHFPNAEIVTLNQNYRSTQTILDSAYKLIQSNNPDRLEVKENINKRLVSGREIKGEEIEFIFTNRVEDEAEEVAKKIRAEVSAKGGSASGGKKRNFNEFAILVRANDHAQPFQRAFDRMKIPFQFLGPGHLFQQEEIKDLIAYLKALANFEDTASLYRVITMPIFDFEARDIAALLIYSKRNNCTLFETMEQVEQTVLTKNGNEKVIRFLAMFKRHLEIIAKEPAGQILFYFFEDSGLLGHYLDPQTVKTEKEAQNIAKFFEKLQSFTANREDASVFAVVDWIDLAMELGESPMSAEVDWTQNNAVNILTVHSSKGLEFPFVFVVNLVAQRFPSRDRKEQIPIPQEIIREDLPEGDENLQEERRLFYVAITRAKEKLFLTASRYYGDAKREKKLSPFIAETLGDSYVDSIVKKQVVEDPGQQLSLLDMFNATSGHNETKPNVPVTPPIYTPTYISYSQLNTFLACPLHYKLRYIMNIPTPASPALSYGVSVHSTLRDFSTAIKIGEKIVSEDISAMLKTNWVPLGYSSKLHERQSYQQAERMLLEFAKHYIAEKVNPIAIEMPFNFWLGNVKIGGRIDRIDELNDGKIEIIDYKTGSNLPTEKKVKDDFQLLFYALAATEVKDALLQRKPSDVVLTLFYLEANKKFSVIHTDAELVLAKEKILKLIGEISNSDFRCSGGMMCKNCEYKMICQTHS